MGTRRHKVLILSDCVTAELPAVAPVRCEIVTDVKLTHYPASRDLAIRAAQWTMEDDRRVNFGGVHVEQQDFVA